MTLPKAVEIATLLSINLRGSLDQDGVDALKLLSQAGKRILYQRTLAIPINHPPLLGEDIV